MADQLTEQQIADFTEAFRLFDTDCDGKIPPSDLGTVMRALGQCPSEDDLVKLIADLGVTDEKPIDFATFLTAMARQMKQEAATQSDLLEAFSVFDKTGEGYITEEDLRRVLGTLGDQLSDDELDSLCADISRNGKVWYKEVVEQLCKD